MQLVSMQVLSVQFSFSSKKKSIFLSLFYHSFVPSLFIYHFALRMLYLYFGEKKSFSIIFLIIFLTIFHTLPSSFFLFLSFLNQVASRQKQFIHIFFSSLGIFLKKNKQKTKTKRTRHRQIQTDMQCRNIFRACWERRQTRGEG